MARPIAIVSRFSLRTMDLLNSFGRCPWLGAEGPLGEGVAPLFRYDWDVGEAGKVTGRRTSPHIPIDDFERVQPNGPTSASRRE